jgi:hypothetical protein
MIENTFGHPELICRGSLETSLDDMIARVKVGSEPAVYLLKKDLFSLIDSYNSLIKKQRELIPPPVSNEDIFKKIGQKGFIPESKPLKKVEPPKNESPEEKEKKLKEEKILALQRETKKIADQIIQTERELIASIRAAGAFDSKEKSACQK